MRSFKSNENNEVSPFYIYQLGQGDSIWSPLFRVSSKTLEKRIPKSAPIVIKESYKVDIQNQPDFWAVVIQKSRILGLTMKSDTLLIDNEVIKI